MRDSEHLKSQVEKDKMRYQHTHLKDIDEAKNPQSVTEYVE